MRSAGSTAWQSCDSGIVLPIMAEITCSIKEEGKIIATGSCRRSPKRR